MGRELDEEKNISEFTMRKKVKIFRSNFCSSEGERRLVELKWRGLALGIGTQLVT